MEKQRFLVTTVDGDFVCVKGSYCYQEVKTNKRITHTQIKNIKRIND